jgi:adenylate cyclase
MAIEIEHKFTLRNDSWKQSISSSKKIRQGYLVTGREPEQASSVRVRISDEHATLNIKSVVLGRARHEFEYSIPLEEARFMLNELCKPQLIEKTRHIVMHQSHRWEIDVFEGDNAGLTIAEIELATENEIFTSPDWVDCDVTDDLRYYNNYLAQHPYRNW